jgi:hypothetical protein
MRFITNLLPQLRAAAENAPHFSRTLSVLGAGHEGNVNLQDLDLKSKFTTTRCAAHTTVMNDFMAEELAIKEPGTSFIHSSPGIVNTGIARELPVWARIPMKVLVPLFSPFLVGAEETGARHLFIATSGLYPPAKPIGGEALAAGVPVPWGLKQIMPGSTGKEGSGAYLVNWNNEITGNTKLLKEYRENRVGKTVWEHTMGVFERITKIN